MDWLALQHDPLWRALWASEEVGQIRSSLERLLVHSKLDDESRGVVRGQLKMLDGLKSMAEALATKEQKDLEKLERVENVSGISRFRDYFPRIT